MLSYHNDPKIKEKYIARMKLHMAQDELIRGQGWDGNKGCAVGCILNRYNHKAFEKELGIPEELARLLDFLYENMSLEKSKTYPLMFLESIPVGVDLENIGNSFLTNTLKRTLNNFDNEKFGDVTKSIKNVINLLENNCQDKEKWSAARSAAESAAEYAAKSAAESAAKYAAKSAARSAARSAAEYAAMSAAKSAAESVARSAAESAAWSADWSAEFEAQADFLIKVLKGN